MPEHDRVRRRRMSVEEVSTWDLRQMETGGKVKLDNGVKGGAGMMDAVHAIGNTDGGKIDDYLSSLSCPLSSPPTPLIYAV